MKQSQSVSDVGVDSAHGWDADEHWWNADEHWWNADEHWWNADEHWWNADEHWWISRCEATTASYRRQRR
jgi:hypothetical protein